MIHKIIVSPESELDELKKTMRKKLMTGGAVLRIEDSAVEADLEKIFTRFSPAVERNNIAAEILVQIAGHPSLSDNLRSRLSEIELPEIQSALKDSVNNV